MIFISRLNVFLILLSSFQSNCVSAIETGTFRKPSSNNDERISALQNDLFKVQTDVLNLNSALVLGDTSESLKTRLATVENEFQTLKQQLDNERRESSTSNGKYDASITTLTNYYNSLDTQLKLLQASMEKKIEEEASRRIPGDIADDIRSHRFSAAETRLLQMADNDNIAKIVHDVYANSLGNADVLLDFAKALTKIDLSYYVLSGLRYEMRSNGHRDPYKMIALVQALEKEVVNQKNGAADVKEKAQSVIDHTVDDIENTATNTLKAAMYADNYQKNVEVETLANAIDDFRSEVSDRVMERIVKEAYPTVSAVKLADNIYSNKYIPQIVSGLTALFSKLQSVNDLNNAAVLKIGDYMSRLQRMANFANLNAVKVNAFNNVVQNMPTCAKNLFFSSEVCIVNRGKSEHLYAASSQFNWNRDRRSIFTWGSKEPVIQGLWFVEKFDDYFYFKNKAHDNEYLYAAGVDPYSSDKRYVLTWISGGYMGDKSAWAVELDGNYCYLKNKHYSEYLFASDDMHSHLRRYVFTWIQGTSIRQPQFQWQITDCR